MVSAKEALDIMNDYIRSKGGQPEKVISQEGCYDYKDIYIFFAISESDVDVYVDVDYYVIKESGKADIDWIGMTYLRDDEDYEKNRKLIRFNQSYQNKAAS